MILVRIQFYVEGVFYLVGIVGTVPLVFYSHTIESGSVYCYRLCHDVATAASVSGVEHVIPVGLCKNDVDRLHRVDVVKRLSFSFGAYGKQ